MTAKKDDEGKRRLDLLPLSALVEVTKVLEHGAIKYGEWNWRNGMKWGRLYAAVLRHLWAWWRGARTDPESGLSHLSHAACTILFLLAYEAEVLGQDDRPEV
jgi:hypothetical protein